MTTCIDHPHWLAILYVGVLLGAGCVVSKDTLSGGERRETAAHVWAEVSFPEVRVPAATGKPVMDLHVLSDDAFKEEGIVFLLTVRDKEAPLDPEPPSCFEDIWARLHLTDGVYLPVDVADFPRPMEQSYAGRGRTSYRWEYHFVFPRAGAPLGDASLEVKVGGVRYWYHMPYGFCGPTPHMSHRIPPSRLKERDNVRTQASGDEKRVAVYWNAASCQIPGEFGDWSAQLVMGGAFATGRWIEPEVGLFPDQERPKERKEALGVRSPATSLSIAASSDGVASVGKLRSASLQDAPYQCRWDVFRVAAMSGPGRIWGCVRIGIGDRTVSVVVPSSLCRCRYPR
jgi:hypothetical protein